MREGDLTLFSWKIRTSNRKLTVPLTWNGTALGTPQRNKTPHRRPTPRPAQRPCPAVGRGMPSPPPAAGSAPAPRCRWPWSRWARSVPQRGRAGRPSRGASAAAACRVGPFNVAPRAGHGRGSAGLRRRFPPLLGIQGSGAHLRAALWGPAKEQERRAEVLLRSSLWG